MRDRENHSQPLPFPNLVTPCHRRPLTAAPRLRFSGHLRASPLLFFSAISLPLLLSQSKAMLCLRVSLLCLAVATLNRAMSCHCYARLRYPVLIISVAEQIISLSRLFCTIQLFAPAFPARQCLSAPMHPPAWQICRGVSQITPAALKGFAHQFPCRALRGLAVPILCGACLSLLCPRKTELFISMQSSCVSYPCNSSAFRFLAIPTRFISMQYHCLACAFISFPSHCFALPLLHISGRACSINSRALRCSAPPMPSSSNRIHVSSMLCRLIAQQVRGDHSSRTSVTLTAPSAWSCLRIRTGPL